MGKLDGKKIAFIAADGVEQIELTQPWEAVKDAGADVELLSLESGQIQGFNHLDHGDKFDVDKTVADADASDYDGLVLPGGVANPDFLRVDDDVRAFVASARDHHHVATPEDVAEVVAWLCSDAARLVTGNVLRMR